MTLRRSDELPVIGTEGLHPLRMRWLPTLAPQQLFNFPNTDIDNLFVFFFKKKKTCYSCHKMKVFFLLNLKIGIT